MRKIIFTIFILGLAFFGFSNHALAQQKIEINFFYSSTCPHCAAEEEFLKGIRQKYPDIEIKEYEVLFHPENRPILKDFYKKYQVPLNDQGLVPATFTPASYFIGFNEQIGKSIESCLKSCSGEKAERGQTVKIPFWGEVDISSISLPVLTIILGTLDGFNPCAMWILIVLISLILPLKSRKKIALVGGTFIFAEGFLYFLMMAAWLNVFLAMAYVSLVRIIIGIVGIGFGIWRIRDFFIWKPGVCKVVDHSKSQEKIMDKVQNIVKGSTVPATIAGVVALAFGTNLIEFFCSAGFPTIYTKVLTLQHLSALQYYAYLGFYNFFYMIDDFIVFGVAFATLRHFKVSEKYNRYSTLVAGILIAVLGILLILKPGLLMFS